MNILILSDGFPPVSNAGAENIAYITAKEYINIGCSVTVVTINNKLSKGAINFFTYDGIKIIQIGVKCNERFIAYASLYNFKIISILKKLINNNDFNVAHIHNIHRYISYGVIGLLKDNKIKTILTTHDAMSIDYGKFTQGINPADLSINPAINMKVYPLNTLIRYRTAYNPFRNIIIKYYLNKVDKVVTVSNALEQLLNINGITNTLTIHNGLPKLNNSINTADKIKEFKSKYNIKKGDKVVLWAGRISIAKGIKQVIQLMDRIVQDKSDIKLFIAGGDIKVPMHLVKNIILSGWLTKEEMLLAYNIANITLVPSIYPDPFPTVVLESLRAGTPVIAGCFGGAKEAVVDKETGYIINPFNTGDFYDKVCEILDDDILHKDMSNKSIEIFNRNLNIDICMNKYMELIKEI
jgi:glycosyltransferase involved in cell wall biosynthesis